MSVFSCGVHRRQLGFSLMEILAILFILAFAVAGVGVTVSTGGPEKRLSDAIEKFATYGQFASEMAALTGEARGVIFEPPDWREDPLSQGWLYRWQKMTAQGWQDDEAIPAVDLPSEIRLSILIEDQLWTWERAPELKLPLVAFSPAGDITEFEVEFTHEYLDDRAEHVVINDWGEIEWKQLADQLREIEKLEE